MLVCEGITGNATSYFCSNIIIQEKKKKKSIISYNIFFFFFKYMFRGLIDKETYVQFVVGEDMTNCSLPLEVTTSQLVALDLEMLSLLK